jgi:hypothetical protein
LGHVSIEIDPFRSDLAIEYVYVLVRFGSSANERGGGCQLALVVLLAVVYVRRVPHGTYVLVRVRTTALVARRARLLLLLVAAERRRRRRP